MNHHISSFKKAFLLGCFAFLLAGASSNGSCGGTEVGEDLEPGTPTPLPTTGCNAETCQGCCYENQCYSGQTFNACGGSGVKCELCSGVKSCSAAQKCELVPAAKWKVRPIEASIVPQDPEDNSAWDLDGSDPDVVVEMRCPQLSASTPFVARTEEISSLTPKWAGGECRVEIGALLGAETQINIIDIDNIFDDPIGTITHQFTQAELEQGTVTLSLPGHVNSLSLQLTRVP